MHLAVLLQPDLKLLMSTDTSYSNLHFVSYCKDKKKVAHGGTVKLNYTTSEQVTNNKSKLNVTVGPALW